MIFHFRLQRMLWFFSTMTSFRINVKRRRQVKIGERFSDLKDKRKGFYRLKITQFKTEFLSDAHT